MTSSISHLLNIGTLATWLSVAGFGALGGMFQRSHPKPGVAELVEPTVVVDDFQLRNDGLMDAEQRAAVDTPREIVPGVLPAPPELPNLADQNPLPAVPNFPAHSQSPAPPQSKARFAAARSGSAATGFAGASENKGQAGHLSSAARLAARLAAGRMQPPSYPPLARRNGQTGTVMVEFTVDAGGRVISAHAKSSSGWELLDSEAVRTVLRWRFPPGDVMKLQRPIVFQLR